MKPIYTALAFVAGAAVGAVAGGLYVKKQAQEEIRKETEAVRAYYKKKQEALPKQESDAPAAEPEPEETAKQEPPPQRDGYSRYAAQYQSDEQERPRSGPRKTQPYVISPEQFDEDPEDYENICLTYFTCGVLADDDDREMSQGEIENAIGPDALTSFGQYEEDTVFVRNDELKAQYEIVRDHRSYEQVVGDKPYLIGG